MFSHVQLHVHWMHLLNTRICRYTCIYITLTVQILHYCPAEAWRCIEVYVTSSRRIDVMCLLGVTKICVLKVARPWKWNLPCSVWCITYKIWTQITPFFICSAWLYVKELEKIIARMHCSMHQSFFRPNYIFNNDAYYLDFRAQKFPLIFFNVNPF